MYVLLCSCTYSIIIRKKLRKLRQMVNHVIRMGLGEKTASPMASGHSVLNLANVWHAVCNKNRNALNVTLYLERNVETL